MAIGAARRLAVGTAVTVTGVVTVATGTFDAGFALQDASGGLYVTTSPGGPRRVGERVRAEGRLEAPHAQRAIAPTRVVSLGTRAPPEPARVDTGVIGAGNEGSLVRVAGIVQGNVVPDPPYGWKLFVDDGSGAVQIFVSTPTGIDVGPLRAGVTLDVTGFSGRYEAVAELLPRNPADVRVVREP